MPACRDVGPNDRYRTRLQVDQTSMNKVPCPQPRTQVLTAEMCLLIIIRSTYLSIDVNKVLFEDLEV